MVRISGRVAGSFVLRLVDLEKISELLQTRVGSTTFSTDCSDDIERVFETLDELNSFENPPTKSITSLSVHASSNLWEKTKASSIEWAAVYFGSDGEISISLSGPEREGSELKNELKDVIDGTRAWYSFATSTLSSPAIYGILTAVWLMYLYYLIRISTADSPQSTLDATTFPVFLLLAVAATAIAFGPVLLLVIGLGRLQGWLFPGAYFALGQGEKRYETKDRIRWISVALIPGIIVSSIFFLLR